MQVFNYTLFSAAPYRYTSQNSPNLRSALLKATHTSPVFSVENPKAMNNI
jgi:hypothetical protein